MAKAIRKKQTGALSSIMSSLPIRDATAKALGRFIAQLLDVVVCDKRSGLMSRKSFPALYYPKKQQITEDH